MNYNSILTNYPFFFYFQGNFSDHPVHALLSIVESNFRSIYSKVISNKIAYLIIEVFQNIEKYSANTENYSDCVLVYLEGDYIHIVSKNPILNTGISDLKTRLEVVSSSEKEKLNNMYLEVMQSKKGTEKGAGLGIIDIARKTSDTLTYQFIPIDENYSFYELYIKLNTNLDTPSELPTMDALQWMDTLYTNKINNRGRLVYSGDFSNRFVLDLLNLIKDINQQDGYSSNTTFHHCLIELVQNCKNYCQELNGKKLSILVIDWFDELAEINTMNFTSDSDYVKLTEKISHLNSLSNSELKQHAQMRLLSADEFGGIGLIDTAQFCRPHFLSLEQEIIPNFGRMISLKSPFPL